MKDVAEIIIGKYAEVKGLDKEEARKRLLPILTEKLRERGEFMERVAGLSKAMVSRGCGEGKRLRAGSEDYREHHGLDDRLSISGGEEEGSNRGGGGGGHE
jgi:hypothetical protein